MYKKQYSREKLEKISFPLGGIGAGSIGLAGNGMLKDWEIFNHPDKARLNGYSHIAVKAKIGGKNYVRVLNGDQTADLIGTYSFGHFSGFGYGPDRQTMCGFPHFKDVTFTDFSPIAELNFSDKSFPVKVNMSAFSPIIPLHEDISSLPAAFFNIEVEDTLTEPMDLTVAFSLMNPFADGYARAVGNGITLFSGEQAGSLGYGELSLLTDSDDVEVQPYWHRTEWMQDNVIKYWNELCSDERVAPRSYDTPKFGDHATVYAHIHINPGEKKSVKFVLSWYVPNRCNDWSSSEKSEPWKNYYAVLYPSALAVAGYALAEFDSLYSQTYRFARALHSSTIDNCFIDAASTCISVLKAATVMRLPDGTFYGFEGAHEKAGACEGTCQHVYNYAYALCFLFPRLEQSIRNAEFKYTTDKDGFMCFRLPLPLGTPLYRWRACLDGQMGTVFKWYREWKLSGDTEWLKANWDKIKLVLDFASSPDNFDAWDGDGDGILDGRQHHTLDIELFGASSWLEGMYLLALKCASEMADYLGDKEAGEKYIRLFEAGSKFTREKLFNGEYFIQSIDLKDKSILEKFGEQAVSAYWDDETGEIKYQVGEGSLLDQLLARWHARILGVEGIFDDAQVKTALKNMYKNNFKENLREVANTCRVFALNDEGGSIICDYPENARKPAVPITYTEECMTGFEYAFGELLIAEGFYGEGLRVIKAIRDRYDGKKRNPFSEIECGSDYARSMAAFGLIPLLAGYSFDLPENEIGFNPIKTGKSFKSPFFCFGGWGELYINGGETRIELFDGSVTLKSLKLPYLKAVSAVRLDGEEIKFTFENGKIILGKPIELNASSVIGISWR